MKERLQKLMAQAGIASRRASEEMIEHGRVRVNGRVALVGDQADPETDVIEVDGRRLTFNQERIYIAINKPRHVITTNVGHRGDERRTVRELVPHEGHLFTIGRLDADSEGLVVLTNDGDLAHRLSHPRFMHTKTYKVVVRGLPNAEAIDKWRHGIFLEEGKTAPAYVSITKGAHDLTTLKVVMTEGKKRQIRRVAMAVGHPVERLVRTHIGMLELGNLRPGEWRELTPREVKEMTTPSPELKEIRRQAGRARRTPPAGTAPEQPERRKRGAAEAVEGQRGPRARAGAGPARGRRRGDEAAGEGRPRRGEEQSRDPEDARAYEPNRKPLRRRKPAATTRRGNNRPGGKGRRPGAANRPARRRNPKK